MSDIIQLENSFLSYDNTKIFYRAWLNEPLETFKTANDKKIIVLLHRGHEHSARLADMATAFVKAGFGVFAWDARGNGLSEGERDHAESFSQLVRDLDEFINEIKVLVNANTTDMMLCASSLGAVIATSYVHDYAPKLRGMIVATPAFAIRLYVPMARPALKVAKKLGIMNRVSSYVKAQVLTHDKTAQNAYQSDTLISTSISRDLLIDSLATGERLLDDAGAITLPTFVLCAGKDYVVDKGVIREFYEKIRSPIKRWAYYPDSFHAIFHEINKQEIYQDCINFANDIFNQAYNEVDLKNADKTDNYFARHSQDRVEYLMAKGFNPQFAMTKFAIKNLGFISDSVATGVKYGFDSGSSLDKVYQNNPKGHTLIGKAIDQFYLNNIGWQGIRIRKSHLLELTKLAIKNSQAEQKEIRLMDIATGNGYYIFELCQQYPQLIAELRDYETHNIQVIEQKINELGLKNQMRAIAKNAFDETSYDKENQFDIAIISGIFELFSDNELIKTALSGVAKQLNQGGYLIYTNQAWHPEQEFIGKTLNSHQGKDWVMRCRSQAEINQLVENAGFKIITMRIDRFGIFSVSLAKKSELDNRLPTKL